MSLFNIFKKIIKYEIFRYKEKGVLGLLLGISILLGFFYSYPIIASFIYCELIKHFEPTILAFFGTAILHILSYFLFNSLLSILYYMEHPSIDKYKCNKNSWPWKEDKESWESLKNDSKKILFLNLFIIGPGLANVSNLFDNKFRTSVETLPTTTEVAYQLLICFICNDFLFHFSHKLLHNNYFYKNIHYVHHQYHNPIGISAEYAHPIEYILGNILPAALGPFLLQSRMHILTLWAWTIFGIGATVEQHSGYDFPFSPYGVFPFTFSASYHDYHHTRFKHNYSSNFVFWDALFGDNSEYFNYLDKTSKVN